MKNLVLSILFLLPFSVSATTIQLVTSVVPVNFTCIIPGHGGGCSVESYTLNAPDDARYVKVFTTFKESGLIESDEFEADIVDSIKLVTAMNIFQTNDDLLMIGTDETLANILFFNAEMQLIETRKVTFKVSITDEY
ncbi:hypothetical protein [Halobacteriovorax sp.]|uniref:hypothetical protein n=1 Tax=Halobacteriovorax sp. TaxID=2020862 RepID=UPI003565E76D